MRGTGRTVDCPSVRTSLLGAAALALLAAGPVQGATAGRAQPNAQVSAAEQADPMAMYLRDDAVGRNMAHLAVTTCGTERWPVKTLTDDDRGDVDLRARDVSVRYLRNRSTPTEKPQTARASAVERTTYRLHARLREYVEEADGDYHLVLSDKSGRTIVVEIPDRTCVGRISPVKAGIVKARSRFDGHFDATTSFKTANRRVVIKGVGFFDYLHGQTGMAPNGLELHPVTGLRFL
jgi:hypothetical protein